MASPEQKFIPAKSEVADPQIDELYRRTIELMYKKSTPGSRGIQIRSFEEALRLALTEYSDKYKKPWRYYFKAVGDKMRPASEKVEVPDPKVEAARLAEQSRNYWRERREQDIKQLKDDLPLFAEEIEERERRRFGDNL